MLTPFGFTPIDVTFAPVLDVASNPANAVIGDRSYGGDPDLVAALGRQAASGLLASGVLPVMKHMPGHGRATADSHLTLPIVEASDECKTNLAQLIKNYEAK